jgi:hypothetical protein
MLPTGLLVEPVSVASHPYVIGLKDWRNGNYWLWHLGCIKPCQI